MGNRLSKIYTRTGDQGTTGMGDGSRIEKDHARVEAIGDIDELNSAVGMLICELNAEERLKQWLEEVQQDLFNLGGELSVPGYELIGDGDVLRLEEMLDQLNDDLPPLKDFILPGGNRAAATCHLARSICRRAERRLVTLSHQCDVRHQAHAYLNRLSDLLFVCARTLARRNGGCEVLWRHREQNAAN